MSAGEDMTLDQAKALFRNCWAVSNRERQFKSCDLRTDHHHRPLRLGLWQATLLVAALASGGALLGCSPYAFSKEVQSLSEKMKLIDTSYQDNSRQILAEKRLS